MSPLWSIAELSVPVLADALRAYSRSYSNLTVHVFTYHLRGAAWAGLRDRCAHSSSNVFLLVTFGPGPWAAGRRAHPRLKAEQFSKSVVWMSLRASTLRLCLV